MVKHSDIDHTGVPGVGGGGEGQQIFALVDGNPYTGASAYGLNSEARMYQIRITAPMRVTGLRVQVGSTGAGTTHTWGVFDCSADATACVKKVGGSGALGSSGWQTLAADSAPVTLEPGSYILIFRFAAASSATLAYTNITPNVWAKNQTGYTWDDTPDVTSGWSANQTMLHMYLIGYIDSGTSAW